MSLQRQYSLPNCKLVLEGLTDEKGDGDRHDVREKMSILVSAECYLAPRREPIAGGVEFFQSLVSAVHNYAQEFLSGIRRQSTLALEGAEAVNGKAIPVQLHKINPNLHRLIVQPQDSYNSEPIQIDLNTVQLFDLVEAVDQFFADTRTLPQMHPHLRPLTKQEARVQEPLAKRALPAAVGVSSLAILALGFFLMPIPEYQRPREPVPEETSTESGALGTSTARGDGDRAPNASPPGSSDLEATLATASVITDPTQLEILEREVYNQIDRAWTTNPSFDEGLVYQVTVGKDGAILGYKAQNQAATNYKNETPLIDLVYVPTPDNPLSAEEIALFEVVFEPSGRLEVSPWQGDRDAQSAAPEINDPVELEALVAKLQQTLYDGWTQALQIDRDLSYRVWMTRSGAIVDYEASNRLAEEYLKQTPLERVHQPSAAYVSNGNGSREALADFRVVFTPRGILEISPWKGYR